MNTASKGVVALSFAFVLSWPPVVSEAKGTARVEQSDGAMRDYDVSIRVIDHRAVRITSVDGRGTLIVGKAACSMSGELERCLPYRIVLDQAGSKHAIDFRRGVEYLNRTGALQQMPLSSTQVPPRGLLLFLVTARGTHITVRGTIDGMSE